MNRYHGEDGSLVDTPFNQVAVKQAFTKPVDGEDVLWDMGRESEHLRLVGESNSQHFTRSIANPGKVQKGDYLEDKWHGLVDKLYLEYCPMKDLRELIRWRGAT